MEMSAQEIGGFFSQEEGSLELFEMPHPYITVTFGLGAPCNDKRIAVVTEAAPNRWTHHTLVHSPEDIDDVLLGWLKSAAQFSIEKGLSSDS